MRWKPQDAVVIVTGATSGIGLCLSRRLLEQGSTVVVAGRRGQRLEQLRTSDPSFASRCIPIVGDVTDDRTRRAILSAAKRAGHGGVDLLVNNAGVGAIGPFESANEERLRRIMEVNFFAAAELTRITIPALRDGRASVICNISSVLGHRAVPNKSEYCASKFAMHGWSDALRAELYADGIQVTLVSPSTTASEFFDALIDTPDGQASPSFGRWTPERVAQAAYRAIVRRRSEVICSMPGKCLVYADRLCPPLVNFLLAQRRKDAQ